MKIVYVFNCIANFAGTERILTDKMNYLSEKPGYEIYIITYEQGEHPLSFPLNPAIKHIDLNVRFFTRYRHRLLKRFWVYARMLRDFRTRFKKAVSGIEPDIIVCSTYYYNEIKTILNADINAVKVIESHTIRTDIGEKRNNRLMVPFLKLYNNRMLRAIGRCDVLVTLTQGDAQLWSGIKEVKVIPNMLTQYPDHPVNSNRKRIISVGRLNYQKRFDLLIAAWDLVTDKHPDWTLDIYGNGEQKEFLMSEIERLNVSDTVTIKPVTHDIYKEYLDSAFLVMSSGFEGFGLVLTEAMSCGIPCISFDCPFGPSEIIRHGEDGLLVENGNIGLLAQNIDYLIEHENIRKEMGAKARENVKRYLPDAIMPQWEELFEGLIKRETKQ